MSLQCSQSIVNSLHFTPGGVHFTLFTEGGALVIRGQDICINNTKYYNQNAKYNDILEGTSKKEKMGFFYFNIM